jgi:D-alanyl-lipoteichoic acid acyltransferase DltB (MBOAT superfamily)
VNAAPVMQRPMRSRTLAEFWGRRWNTSFHRIAIDLMFRPLCRCFSARGVMFITFVLSGLLHELVITVPARGGIGGPTVYFALQGAALLVERSFAHAGTMNRLFTFAMLILPLPLLFPRAFVLNVIAPMLVAIGGG